MPLLMFSGGVVPPAAGGPIGETENPMEEIENECESVVSV